MTKLKGYADISGKQCWARFRMKNNDPCYLGVADSGVLIKKSITGLLGKVLYKESNVYNLSNQAKYLMENYPENLMPNDIRNPYLKYFGNAILHCRDCSEVANIMNMLKKDDMD